MYIQIKRTCLASLNYRLLDKLPKIGDKWIDKGYEDAYIYYIKCVNNMIAETTPGNNPTYFFNFYDVYIEMDEDNYIEHVCIKKGE